MNIEAKARGLSDAFLSGEREYRLGFVEAELSNPLTKTLGEDFMTDGKKGISTLLSADRALLPLYEQTLFSDAFENFRREITEALSSGGRIIISGCGSTGRLAMRIEASFRIAVRKIAEEIPEALAWENSVIELMTGGDYAIIRSVEAFEDYTALGEAQARELGIGERDILVGVTATGETTSILGTARYALSRGARVWMVICTDPQTLVGRLERADAVYRNEKCRSLYMHCGGMALTGSTRMQSSTIEQTVIYSALEMALSERFGRGIGDRRELVRRFGMTLDLIARDEVVEMMLRQLEAEAALYEQGGRVTYYADEYLLDVLADTTERAPTFSVPHFRPRTQTGEPLSWAFVKNPRLATREAWCSAFERVPRCIDKTPEQYREIGIKAEDIGKIPKIDLASLYKFEIGSERDPEREGENTLATWISFDEPCPPEFLAASERYGASSYLVLPECAREICGTATKMFEHLAVKLMINVVSTGTMAKMGRIRGNYMVYISISNKKLIDRATRIVADLCGVDYERANYELFLSKLLLEEAGIEGRTAIETIDRLKKQALISEEKI